VGVSAKITLKISFVSAEAVTINVIPINNTTLKPESSILEI